MKDFHISIVHMFFCLLVTQYIVGCGSLKQELNLSKDYTAQELEGISWGKKIALPLQVGDTKAAPIAVRAYPIFPLFYQLEAVAPGPGFHVEAKAIKFPFIPFIGYRYGKGAFFQKESLKQTMSTISLLPLFEYSQTSRKEIDNDFYFSLIPFDLTWILPSFLEFSFLGKSLIGYGKAQGYEHGKFKSYPKIEILFLRFGKGWSSNNESDIDIYWPKAGW